MSSGLRGVRSDDGNILVAAAIIMVSLVLLGAVLIQVGSWFQNRRHLQVRADAGAFAAAQLFNECFDPAYPDPAIALTDMENWASRYAGFSSLVGTPENTQFGTGSSSSAFQSASYPGGGGPGTDDLITSNPNPCDQVNITSPHGGFDVKLRQGTIRGLFSFAPLANVYAHARVQIKEVESITPSFPLAIPEIVPNAVGVTFVNEDTGKELTGCTGNVAAGPCTFALTDTAPAGTDPYHLGPWQFNGAGVSLPTPAANAAPIHIAMRVGLGAAVQSCAGYGNGATWLCYNTDTSFATPHGVVMIDDLAGSQTAPKLLSVVPSTCSGTPFAGVPPATPPCYGTLAAKIDFGVADPTTIGAKVKATFTQDGVTPAKPQAVNMTYDATTGLWTTPFNAVVSVNPPAGGSEYGIDLSWTTTKDVGGIKGNNGSSWQGLQRVIGATDSDDGPVSAVSLADATGANPYSYVGGGSHSLNIGVLLQHPFNKLTLLRQAFSGSGTSFILCRWKEDRNGNPIVGTLDSGQNVLADSMQKGCDVPFTINGPNTCPDSASDPTMPDCAQNKPCSSCGNTITKALDARFGCTGTTVQWPNRWGTPDGYSYPGDPRAVTLVTTSFAALGNGSSLYPVTGFGAFYIAGVAGNACHDTWQSVLGTYPGDNSGAIWGYFIKYTNLSGTPSSEACQLNSFNNCVAVLTR